MELHIDHIALCVRDLEGMRAFYTQWFGAVAGDEYHNPQSGLRTYFLRFGSGARMELMTRPGIAERDARTEQYGLAHLAFQLAGREAVDRLTARLQGAGCVVASAPRVTGDGYYESCVLDPEGNHIELVG